MATEIKAVVDLEYGLFGVLPQYAVKLKNYGGLAAAAVATIVNYTESPFNYDVVIVKALMNITTLDAQDADLDIGIANTATGTGMADNLLDSPANDAVAVLEGLAATAIAGKALPLWKAKGSATMSFVCSEQNLNADASSLKFNLILVCVPMSAIA